MGELRDEQPVSTRFERLPCAKRVSDGENRDILAISHREILVSYFLARRGGGWRIILRKVPNVAWQSSFYGIHVFKK